MTGNEGRPGVLLLLLDGFRWDYLDRTTFLRTLAEESAVGRLEEPFGFMPRSAYFRGVDAEPGSFTHMFRWDPGRSPFGAARFLGSPDGARNEMVRRALAERARTLVSPFAGHYADTASIPLDRLACFDLAEQTAAWGDAAACDSLFRVLDERGRRTFVLAWPETNGLTDAAVVARALADLEPHHEFAFVHLSALDAAGHRHGPGSRRTQEAIEETDRLAGALLAHCRRIWSGCRAVVFGDHGMVAVIRSVDVEGLLRRTGLRFGRDFGYFVDSTTVRFWFFTRAAERAVRAVLDGSAGRFLAEGDLRRLQIDACDGRNGELIFLADPGVVFAPSFFDAAHVPRGMHGYDPTYPDNQGAFVFWDSRDRHPREAGVVAARRLYATCLAACGVEVPAGAPCAVRPEALPLRSRCYTFGGKPSDEAIVADDLDRLRTMLRLEVPDCEAIVAAGSFGRGEGCVRSAGTPVAVNDYDVLVIGGAPRRALADVREDARRACRAEAVDIGHVAADHLVPTSQMGYDLRWGGRMLYGHEEVLRDWGATAPADLTREDAWIGLSNRVCGVLSAWRPKWNADPRHPIEGQFQKLAIALGDAYLVLWGDYHHRWHARRDRFDALAPVAGVDPDVREVVVSAYSHKLGDDAREPWAEDVVGILAVGIQAFAAVSLVLDPRTSVSEWAPIAARSAVLGRVRQWVVPRSATPATPAAPFPEGLAATLAQVFASAWTLYFEWSDRAANRVRPGGTREEARQVTVSPDTDWDVRRRAATQRWLELLH